ncbi:hypothetical protein STSP2_03282 [Anaerohalosphaera lusitana]|uniref:Uncharacterized protein n=1 Tax=Anaerohalosphaera lusitana TaxID=1936003 RepID=A0A1U9NR31_9BACT|nr:hypothetical protein [Anaerohalosphaera lusitana]AQT70080.1 hypothetical protein STSP2_03282 [Anaerohalosphaera lusitana]
MLQVLAFFVAFGICLAKGMGVLAALGVGFLAAIVWGIVFGLILAALSAMDR